VKNLAAVALLLATVGVAVVLAQRIITNPKPEAHLKALFPAAAAFSPLSGEPLHFTAFATDPKSTPPAPPIGYAFWTTDIVPNEHGYHGPIHVLVGLDLKGVITGAIVDTIRTLRLFSSSRQPPRNSRRARTQDASSSAGTSMRFSRVNVQQRHARHSAPRDHRAEVPPEAAVGRRRRRNLARHSGPQALDLSARAVPCVPRSASFEKASG
jgi:hypothetical protein